MLFFISLLSSYDFNSSDQPYSGDAQVALMAVTDAFVDVARRHNAVRVA